MTTRLLTQLQQDRGSCLCETRVWKQFVFPSHFTWEAHPPAGPCPLPAGSPAHKGALSPLNDKQFSEAEAVKCIRQVQGSLPNQCLHGAAARGRVNAHGEYTRRACHSQRGSEQGWERRGCTVLGPFSHSSSFPGFPLHTHTGAPSLSGHIASPLSCNTTPACLRSSKTHTCLQNPGLISRNNPHCPNRIKSEKYL